ncbi:MAG: alanyl-tRNA editing protein [Vicinamibacteria bacterium]
MTIRLFLDDPELLEFDAVVRSRTEHEGRPAVVLDRTAFYAESGGQPWDTGALGDARVVAVVESGGDVLHVLDCPLGDDRVHGRVDADRRRDHVQQHHGQHLLSRAFVETARAGTVAFHLGAEVTTIDLDRPVTAEQARAAERRANEVVWEARPVTITTIAAAEAKAQGLEAPAGVERVRVVDADGWDRQPCGGTHPRSTAGVGVVLVVGLERYKGGTRVSFVCGHRALAAMARRGDVIERLVGTLSAPIDELPAAAQKAKDDLAAAQKAAKASSSGPSTARLAGSSPRREATALRRRRAPRRWWSPPTTAGPRPTCEASRPGSWRWRPASPSSAAARTRRTSCSRSPTACPTTCPRSSRPGSRRSAAAAEAAATWPRAAGTGSTSSTPRSPPPPPRSRRAPSPCRPG